MKRELITEIENEINRANIKHNGELANSFGLLAILIKEIGEFAQDINKGEFLHSRKELIQVIAVACNFLEGTGPHVSTK